MFDLQHTDFGSTWHTVISEKNDGILLTYMEENQLNTRNKFIDNRIIERKEEQTINLFLKK